MKSKNKATTIKSKNVQLLNSSVYVMRHFVELSAKLLPYYERITRNAPHSIEKIEEKEKIDAVYENYPVSAKSSEFLLGSNIIDLITKIYQNLQNRTAENELKTRLYLKQFQNEYKRLQQNWYTTLMN